MRMIPYPVTLKRGTASRFGSPAPAGPWIVLLAFLLCGPAPAATDPERLEDYLQGLQSLTADFRQFTLSSDGNRVEESRGTLYLKRPGKFRWEYEYPVKQIIVADGKRVWLHDLELDQVSHRSQRKALGGTPAQLLATEGPVGQHFEVTPWDAGDEREWIELRPRAKDTQVVRIRIGFVGKRLDTLLMEDSFGQVTRFVFTGTKRNPRLDKDLFRLDASAVVDFLRID